MPENNKINPKEWDLVARQPKKKTWRESWDSPGGSVVKFIDPTGVSSYGDVYRTIQNPEATKMDVAWETLGALPGFKYIKILKGLGKLGDASRVIQDVDRATSGTRALLNAPNLTGRAAEVYNVGAGVANVGSKFANAGDVFDSYQSSAPLYQSSSQVDIPQEAIQDQQLNADLFEKGIWKTDRDIEREARLRLLTDRYNMAATMTEGEKIRTGYYEPSAVSSAPINAGDDQSAAYQNVVNSKAQGGSLSNWDSLSLTERAKLMRLFVKSNVTSLSSMKEQYNSFKLGGDIDPNEGYNARLQEFYNNQASEVRQEAHRRSLAPEKKAIMPIMGYDENKNPRYGEGCMYTASENYGLKEAGTRTFQTKHKDYGFSLLPLGEKELPGDITLGYFGDIPRHAMIFSFYDSEGNPRYNDSNGGNVYHRERLPFMESRRTFRYVGTDADRTKWKAEYDARYPRENVPMLAPLPIPYLVPRK